MDGSILYLDLFVRLLSCSIMHFSVLVNPLAKHLSKINKVYKQHRRYNIINQ